MFIVDGGGCYYWEIMIYNLCKIRIMIGMKVGIKVIYG